MKKLSHLGAIPYLGVHISQDLKWNSHINFISSKANQTLGFLRRNLKINSQTIKEKAYKSIVRPKLEYCNSVWDPKCIKNPKDGDKTNHRLVYQLEMVQRRVARWVTGRYHNTSSVSDMLRSLDWRSLEQRRVDSRLSILYKIRNHLVQLMRAIIYREALDDESTNTASWEQTRTTHAFLSSPGQSYSGTSFQVKSAWQSRSIPSRPRSRRSSTLDSISPKHSSISLSFSFFTSFCLSYPYYSYSSFFSISTIISILALHWW